MDQFTEIEQTGARRGVERQRVMGGVLALAALLTALDTAAGSAHDALAGGGETSQLEARLGFLLGQLGVALVQYNANLIDLNSLWQTDLMLCCLFVLATWKLTNAANLERRLRGLRRPPGTPPERRRAVGFARAEPHRARWSLATF